MADLEDRGMPWPGIITFINSDSLALPLVPKIYRLGFRLGMKQPVWKHTREIRRSLRFWE